MVGEYFSNKYNLDFRSLRYPGIISSEKYAFNGTTDYSTEIFFHLLEKGNYKCFLKDDAALPMMYIDDCIEATVRFLKADPNKLLRSTYNLAGISFTPKELTEAIMKLIPNTTVTYEPDFRQAIAESWPKSIDDHECKLHWNWEYDISVYDLAKKIFDGIDIKYKT
jgi:threonine 3-dehydrogenase